MKPVRYYKIIMKINQLLLVCVFLILPGVLMAGSAHVRIIPEPQELVWKGTGFQINAKTKIIINAKADEKNKFTANQLRRKIWAVTGLTLPLVESKPCVPTRNVIAVGDKSKNRAVASILSTWPGKAPKSEGYILGVKNDSIVVSGFDQRGTFYGCQTLIQLVEHYGKKRIGGLFCYDYPDFAWRGTMVRIRDDFDVDFTKEIISEVMARYKLNTIQIHMSYGVIWPSHPELFYDRKERAANPTTFAQIKQVADYAKLHFMEVVPAGVSWSHSWEWQTAEDMNPDLLESTNPKVTAENICPRNPKAQKLMQDLLQDQINAFHPKYINMGWDEIGAIGTCPYCKGEDPAKLFADYLQRDRDYLNARGIRTIIYADMFRKDMNGGPPRNLYKTLEIMPKDIILQDWAYTGHHEDFPTLQTWNDNGLQSLGMPYGVYPPGAENIYSWASAAKRHNVLGIVAFNKYRCASKKTVLNTPHWMAEAACYPFIGEWSWTVDRPGFDPLPYDGQELVRQNISPDLPSDFSASSVNGKVILKWKNPPETKFQGTWICYRTDRHPTHPLDGTFVCDIKGSPDGPQTFTHTKAPKGNVYYAAFSHDSVRHFSPPALVFMK